jgi:hypothetical protein
MRVVGSAKGIDIHAPVDAYFSYFNSPYIGHNTGSAIDIYPFHQEWCGLIDSPISGRIVRIKKMQMGKPRQFPTEDNDYAVGILPEGFNDYIVRVMHCEPVVSEGEFVDLGDPLGKTVRSRYFNYWTGPHYHVEIQPLESFHRSSQSEPLLLDYEFQPTVSREPNSEVHFHVESVTSDCIIGYTDKLCHSSIGDLSGLSANTDSGRIVGILDGGLSHYKLGGVIGSEELVQGEHVNLSNSPVGTISECKRGVCVFSRGPSITVFLDKVEVRGISCFIYPKQYIKKQTPQLILIPKSYGEFNDLFREDEVYELRILSNNNMVKG